MTLHIASSARDGIRGDGAAAESMNADLIEQLRAIAPTKTAEPLSRHTTFGIGGPADVFVTVRNANELARAVLAARAANAPCFVLGAGSNIVVGDAGIRGVVIDNEAKGVQGPMDLGGACVVRAESGTPFASLARHLAREGYGGIEWAAGIPGTLGGAVVYNAGAYGGCLADVLRRATLLDSGGETRVFEPAELELTYRNSIFTRGECRDCVVLSVELRLTRTTAPQLMKRIADFDDQRLGAQPRGRNSGSTFKNPEGRQAWELIDAAGMRGERIGDARVSEKHSNFFENLGNARAADVVALMREAQRRVREQSGIELQNEVELVGEGFE